MTLVFLFTFAIGNVWADTTYKLFYGATKDVNGTTLNSEDFFTTLTSTEASHEVAGTTYAVKLGYFGGGVEPNVYNKNTNRFIRYDVKTTSVEIEVVAIAKNKNRTVKIGYVKEPGSSTTASEFSSNALGSLTLSTANTGAKSDKISFTTAVNASIIVSAASSATDIQIIQVTVTEKGTPLPKPGDDGYAFRFQQGTSTSAGAGGRHGGGKAVEIPYEGGKFVCCLNSEHTAGTGLPAKLTTKGTHYIKFTTAAYSQVNVAVGSSNAYYIADSKNPSSGTTYTADASVEIDAGTWYIVPNGSDVTIKNISFEEATPATKHHVTYSLGGDYGTTPTQADVAEGAKFNLHNGTTGITAPTGKQFGGWNDGTTTYAGGAEYTMGTDDVELTAVWETAKTNPTATFSNGAYVVGASALDLSSLWTDATSDGAVTYALKVASDDATVSGTSFTATKAGSYVVVATQAATSTYNALVKEATITVTWPATGAATITYEVKVGTGQTTLDTNKKEANSASISNLVGFTTAGGLAVQSGGGKTASSPKIATPTAKDDTKYVYVTFDVASGYIFTINSVTTKMVAVSKPCDIEVELSDATTNEALSYNQTNNNDPGADHEFEFAGKAYEGTVTLKIYAYGVEASSYRIGKPLTISGTVAVKPSPSAPVISAPDADQAAVYDLNDVITPLSITANGYPTPTYQWYKNSSASTEGATAIEGAQSASYTPASNVASDLYYYCVASNSQGSATSHYFHVTVNAPAVPTIYTETTALTLTSNKVATASETFTFSGANLGETAVTLVLASAVDGLTLSESSVTPTAGAIADTEITVSYKSLLDVAETDVNLYLKQGDDILKTIVLTYSSTAGIESLTSISAATTWNWDGAADAAFGTLDQNAMIVLANADVTWDAGFNALAIAGKLQHYYRDSKYAQGHELKFNTTVPGRVYVTYSNTGNNAARTVNINGTKGTNSSSNNKAADIVIDNALVSAGDVLIKGIQVSDDAANMLRYYKVEFVPTYTVAYAANGGSGDMTDANTYVAGDEVTLLPNTFTPASGFVWSAWSVKDKDNNDIPVTSGKFTMPASNVTVTAQWVVDNGMARLYRSDDTEDANSPYATLAEAVAAAQDGDKIVLQRNVADGAGIMLTKDDHKTLTIDFGGYTYTAVSPGVGSAGTQNQAFHLEKGNTVTLRNGTITSSGSTIKMLIQNYCDLTLENITLDGTGLEGSHRYVMSNNCGDVVIGDGTTITAKADDVAFDVCATNYYPEGVTVTVKDGATISGIVEYDVWGTKPANNQATLAIEGGDFDITWNVESALAEDAKENLNVSAGSFSEEVPVEYCAAGYIPAPQDPITNKYTVKEGWKVTFVDGEDEEIVAVDKNTPVAEKAMSDKIGYTFDGWFNGVDLYDFAANVTADLTLNAQWAAFAGCADLWPATSGAAPTAANQEITLQTGSNGGHIYTVSAKNDKFNESFEYTENGFALKKGGDDVIRVEMANDIVAGTKISVTLKSGDTGARGLNLLTATGAKVKGGTKLGWDDATVGAVETFSYTVEAGDGLEGTNIFRLQRNNSVYLQCVRVESCGAAIVYHNLTSAVNIAGKGTVTLGATSVREGYTTTATYSEIDPLYEFVNWTVSGAGASVENATANPATITVGTEDAVVTLNLQLIPVKFTVNYYDGTTAMGTELVPVNEHPTASEINTNKRHYTFQGWSETDGGSVVALNTITRTEATTVNLYAKYEPVVCPTSGTIFSMEFDETKKPGETVTIAKDASIDLAEYATISGGNAMIINGETSGKDAISTDGEFLLKATKEVMKVELNCVLQEGDIIRIPDNSAKLVISTSNAKTGTYQAFADKNTHEFAVTAAWAGVDDIYVLYDGSSLKFTKVYVIRPAKFDVSFNMMGHGTQIADIEDVIEGSKITAPAAPTDEDFAFAGWYKENTLENEWDFDNDVVSANTTLFAKWLDKSDATLKSLKYGTTDIELEDGVYEYEIALAAATASVPALTAVTNNPAANAAITNAAAFDGEGKATSTVEVTPQKEGAAHLTYTVKFSKLAALPQVNVTGSTTWNFSAGGSTTLTNQSDIVLANLPGINNDENFNSQALLGSFNKLEGNYFQGSKLSFTTEVPGKLTITFRGTNDHARHLQVCVGDGETVVADWNYNNSSTSQTKTIFVPEGKVTLKAFEGDVAQNARIYNMIFNATPDYTRDVTEGRYGTICLPNGGVMVGAELYEVAYYDGTVEKIFLDEVLNGEMVAGRPYIFLTKEGVDKIAVFYTDGANASAGDYHGLFGSYSRINLDANGHIYILKDNRYYLVDSDNVYCGENRAYFKMGVAGGISGSYVAPAPGRRRMSIGAGAPKLPTGIENTGFESDAPRKVLINGELYIIRGEKMYDAKGQLVK